MKDKKILAMFITSAVALVASVVVTLGVALSLADPVPVRFVTECEVNFGSVNTNESVTVNGNVITYNDAFEYAPVAPLYVESWDADTSNDIPVFPLKNQEFGVELQIDDSNVGKLKIAYVKVNNDNGSSINVSVTADYAKSSDLGKYTKVVVFDYQTNLFSTDAEAVYAVPANGSSEFAVILYTDVSNKHDSVELLFGEAKETVSIVVEKVV